MRRDLREHGGHGLAENYLPAGLLMETVYVFPVGYAAGRDPSELSGEIERKYPFLAGEGRLSGRGYHPEAP